MSIRGVCLLYRFPESFFLDPANEILGTVNVDYKANSLTEWLSGDFSMGMRQFIKELAKVYLRAKAPAGTMKVRYGYFASSKGFSTSTSEC